MPREETKYERAFRMLALANREVFTTPLTQSAKDELILRSLSLNLSIAGALWDIAETLHDISYGLPDAGRGH